MNVWSMSLKRVQQASYWVVTQLEEATAVLKQLHGILECTVPLSDLLLPRESVP